MTVANEPLSPEDRRLLLIPDTLLPGAMIIDPRKHRIAYVNSEAARIVDIDGASFPEQVNSHFITIER
ncbi:MAG: hypothetical protein GY697_02505 [Desulfobacterales bacterium]|nr:hypothetical protein [Desulfobacterales bacterium]